MCQFAVEGCVTIFKSSTKCVNHSNKKSRFSGQSRGKLNATCLFRALSISCTFFLTLSTGCMFFPPYAWQRFLFPAFVTGCIFSRASHRQTFFPLFAPVAYFSALFSGCMFSRRWSQFRFDWFIASYTSAVIGQMLLL